MKGTPVRPVQHFSDDYLAGCRQMSVRGIAEFLENFRLLHGGEKRPSRLISLKVPPALLEAFRESCRLAGVRYQTQIKLLMTAWLEAVSGPRREGRAPAPRSGRSGKP